MNHIISVLQIFYIKKKYDISTVFKIIIFIDIHLVILE